MACGTDRVVGQDEGWTRRRQAVGTGATAANNRHRLHENRADDGQGLIDRGVPITAKSPIGDAVAIRSIFAALKACARLQSDYNRAMPITPREARELPRLTLILGGVRSGKSRHAERLIEASGLRPCYIATAEALDGEMTDRIARHKERRGDHWQTIEEPLALSETLRSVSTEGRALMVDCLTLWLTNLMVHERPVEAEIDRLLETLAELDGATVLVSNEVGQGVIPMNAMARAFVDHAGLLHQKLALLADRVLFMTAGLARQLKP
jgi:adenosylcobinamide kinase/adenosylcobinamide-phosphate guanylyltransferase